MLGIALILTVCSYNNLNQNLRREKKTQIKQLVNSALGTLRYYHSLVEKGELSRQEAQQKAQNELRVSRFGPKHQDYFWIQNQKPEMIMHPFTPELEGEDLADIQDEAGNYLFRDMVETVEEKGAGFVEYHWQYYDNQDRVEPKLAYVKSFDAWNWIIGTGIYINDIQTSLIKMRNRIIIISFFILIIALLMTYLIANYITKPIEITTSQAELIAEGNLKEEIPQPLLNRKDEIGSLAAAFKTMKVNLKSIIDELKETQQELEKNKENLFITLQSIGDGVIVTDTDGCITRMNPRAEKITGWRFEEAEGKPFSEIFQIINTKTRDTVENPVKKVLASEEIIGLANDTILIAKGGTEYQIADSAAPIKNHKGNILGVVLVFRDVTEKYRKEQKIKESEKKYRTLVNKSPIGIFRTTFQGEVLSINPAMAKILGCSSTEKALEEYRDLSKDLYVNPDRRKEFIDQLKKNDEVNNFEYKAIRADGTYIWLQMDARMSKKYEGDSFIIEGFVFDISERKQQEDKIRYISFHDSLTDLYNRTYLEEEIERLDVKRQLPISLIMADLNGLKIINDTYGHEKGDQFLLKAAKILKDSCRKEDIIARWGGDEFIILLPQTELQGAQKVCERINELSGQTEEEIPISIAHGTAVKEIPEQDIYNILNKAEEKMYKNKLDESRSTKSHIVKTLLNTLGEKSNETKEHAWRMQELALAMGNELNFPQSELDRLSLLATLHDIGKTIIPETILTKPGKLTEKEWETIQEHPETGYRITSATEEFVHIAEEVLFHHERWNGTGYPNGLEGEEIPLLARVISIVDAYDVMTNGRPYKKPMSQEEALEELKKCAGTQFDPELVECFVRINSP